MADRNSNGSYRIPDERPSSTTPSPRKRDKVKYRTPSPRPCPLHPRLQDTRYRDKKDSSRRRPRTLSGPWMTNSRTLADSMAALALGADRPSRPRTRCHSSLRSRGIYKRHRTHEPMESTIHKRRRFRSPRCCGGRGVLQTNEHLVQRQSTCVRQACRTLLPDQLGSSSRSNGFGLVLRHTSEMGIRPKKSYYRR